MTIKLDMIIEPDELEAVLDHPDLLIVDVSQPQSYQSSHVPGAVHVSPADLTSGMLPAPGKLPPKAQLEAVFSRIGYSPDKHIVVYDEEGGGWAGRFIWTLDIIGHRAYSYLNGGLHAWQNEGHAVDNRPTVPQTTEVSLTLDRSYIADMDAVYAALGNDDIRIWDARSEDEFTGRRVAGLRGGHIPGAINLDWLEMMDKSRNLRLRPLNELQEKLDALGMTKDKEIITHCQTHHRSGLTYFVARALGYRVRAYDGSWAEWGNNPETPVETVAGAGTR